VGEDNELLPWLLLKKADDGLKAIEYLRTGGYRAGIVSIAYVICVNAARSALSYDGCDCEPTAAFELFDKYYSDLGKFDPNLGDLFKTVCRYKYQSEFNPLFALADAEMESLISRTQTFFNDVDAHLRGK
jgi:hypothetical protein